MDKNFQSILNWVYNNFKKDASKMLIWTGVAGWSLSSFAQICGILFNPEIPKEQKGFLVPQECGDALVNIGSFFLITQLAKKSALNLFKTGKFAPKTVREFLEKNKKIYGDKIGKIDFDLGKVLEKDAPDLVKNFNAYKDFGTTVATVGAGVVSSNIITPIIRNKMASNMQKDYIARKQASGELPLEDKKQPTFKSSYNYTSSMYGLKI